MLAPQAPSRLPSLHLLQEPDDLLVSESPLLHAQSLLRKSDSTNVPVALKTGVRARPTRTTVGSYSRDDHGKRDIRLLLNDRTRRRGISDHLTEEIRLRPEITPHFCRS